MGSNHVGLELKSDRGMCITKKKTQHGSEDSSIMICQSQLVQSPLDHGYINHFSSSPAGPIPPLIPSCYDLGLGLCLAD